MGNKTDLPKELRQVPTEKGKEYARSLNSLFAETSAAQDTGVCVCLCMCVYVLCMYVCVCVLCVLCVRAYARARVCVCVHIKKSSGKIQRQH